MKRVATAARFCRFSGDDWFRFEQCRRLGHNVRDIRRGGLRRAVRGRGYPERANESDAGDRDLPLVSHVEFLANEETSHASTGIIRAANATENLLKKSDDFLKFHRHAARLSAKRSNVLKARAQNGIV